MRKTPLRPGRKAELRRTTRLKDTPLERTSELTRSRLRAPGTPARTDRGARRSWNSTLPVSRKPLKAKGGSRFPKRRQPTYTAWIKTLPCLISDAECWRGPVDPAHVGRTRSAGAEDIGQVVPLCRFHHSVQEGRTARFNARYGIDLAAIAAALPTRYGQEAA